MKTSYFFLFSFLFLFLFVPLVSSTPYVSQSIPDAFVKVGSSYQVRLFDTGLCPNCDYTATYVQFRNPDTGSLTTLLATGNGGNNVFHNNSKFNVTLGGNNGDTGLLLISSNQIFDATEFTIFLSTNPSSSQYSDKFLLTSVAKVPSQISTPRRISLSSAYSTQTKLLSTIFSKGSYNALNISYGSDSKYFTYSDDPSCFTYNNTEICVTPFFTNTPTFWPQSDFKIVFKSKGVSSSGLITLNASLNDMLIPYYGLSLFASSAEDMFYFFTGLSHVIFSNSVTIPFEVYISNSTSVDTVPPIVQNNTVIDDITESFTNIYPPSDDLSLGQKISYVLITMFLVLFISILGTFATAGRFLKGIVFIVAVIELILLAFFMAIGYIPVIFLIVLILALIGFLIFGRRG